ncbi:uroporphyrinogen-III synthase [Jannaschia ovalis]|uniref:Uroporphyrinogen-III synthase n=1 Tax=Jannaschia ovalis TaxID=3038773 RepID=A0ABY8L8R5_9RHOB|nr:uroporphyrinogen-III synthase [Jannaschia sp. GRR-S6-38]WGH77691.1 uroporphyrinogen-III synthase [Jannaschia sp. GRR-S6-38]
MRLPILLTRPDAASREVAAHLAGERIVISPLIEVAPFGALPADLPDLLLSSRNAVAAYVALGGGPGRAAWVVGPGTAEAARAAGLSVRATAPDAATLAREVPVGTGPLLHLRGEVQRGDLAGDLRARGIPASDAVIYRQTPLALSAEALALLRAGPVLVPLYSPRSAALFGDAVPPEARGNLRLVCLSRAVAAAAPVPPDAVACAPDGPAMLAAIREVLDRNGG